MQYPLTPIRFLDRAAGLYGHKEGIVSGEKRFTFAEFAERARRLASVLPLAGLRPGDRVAYLSFNTHQLLEGYYGVIQAQGIIMPLNVRLSPPELIAILNHSEARLLLYENDFTPLVQALRGACPSICAALPLDAGYEELLAQGKPEAADIAACDENAIAELFYTSGSTGTPKGVMLSHRTLYLHGLSVAATFNYDDRQVELHTIPLFHANGWGRPHSPMMMGIRQVMVRRFEPGAVLRLIQEEKATCMSLVPTMAGALLASPDLNRYDCSSLEQIHLGGAAASPELVERMEAAFRCRVMGGYGLTETSPVITSARDKSTVQYAGDAERRERRAMAGWPIPGVDVRVVDASLQDVPRDMRTIGEVVVRGDHVMDGYFKDPEATAAAMTGAWLRTGDMAVWDRENYVHIVDRRKDIIISGGENISSLEVEKAIFAHPAVLECAVVGAPDPKWGEAPVAFVVAKPGERLSETELLDFLRERLAAFKLPRAIEFSEAPLPKTGTGKIMKRALREKFWAGRERRVQG
ncbi:MAG: long-chain-fatty-acid--CoA ligase [Bryobacterales bacterium]|nr:long-chain-fatty-acid--CoA ligase [Bryobacterales bacterium]